MFIALSNKKSILTFALEIKSLIEAVRSNPSTMPFESCSKRFVTDLVRVEIRKLKKKIFQGQKFGNTIFISHSRCRQKIQNS